MQACLNGNPDKIESGSQIFGLPACVDVSRVEISIKDSEVLREKIG